ncbi:MAG: protein kinase [Clostridia bacterium]|nr:protein kinase [Clostridia bacterium]
MSKKYSEFIGKVLDRRYKILELVGEGGMAFVFKAEDLIMNRLVAIKILNNEYNSDKAMVQRFINESKAVAMLSHKNIVSIYDVAIYDDMKYIVMEFLDGITLKEYIDSKGLLFWKEGCFYTIQILKALEHAHSKGVIHRDIKPQNIILKKNGEIKVTDFGIAKLPNASSLTVAEKAIGTVYYISPEQASGKRTDFHTDLYSVGIMLYEMCTGRLPFVHENAINVALMQVNDAPTPPISLNSAIPEGLNQIVLRAMEKEPEARFPSAHGMLKALEVVYNNPDVVFTSGSAEAALLPNAVNIDSIVTASIEDIAPYTGVDSSVFASKKINQQVKEPAKTKNKKKKSGLPKLKSENRKRSLFTGASHSMFPIILGISLAFLIVVGSILVLLTKDYVKPLFDGSNDPIETVIPDLEGQIYNEDLVNLLRNEYKVAKPKVVYERSDKPKDEIIMQHPEGAVTIPEGNELYTGLTVTVSKGPDESVYKDMLYYSESYVKKHFEDWGVSKASLDIYDVSEKTDNLPDDVLNVLPYASTSQVLRIEVMRSGTYIKLVDGDVIKETDKFRLYVFYPENTVTMPDLCGLTVEDVEKLLDGIGLALGEVEIEESEEEDGIVIWQEHAEEAVVSRATKVDIKVSKQCKFMPDIIGLEEKEARDVMMNDADIFKYRFVYEQNSEEDEGTVIKASHEAGDPVFSDETVIITVVGKPDEVSEMTEESNINGTDDE